MHINDVYALRSVLNGVARNEPVNMRTLLAVMDAVNEEITEFEVRLEEQALAEEAMQS